MANWVKYDADILEELKVKIKDKNEQLLFDINKALATDDRKTYDYLKPLQLQCDAQLRFIKLLESNFDDNDYIIC